MVTADTHPTVFQNATSNTSVTKLYNDLQPRRRGTSRGSAIAPTYTKRLRSNLILPLQWLLMPWMLLRLLCLGKRCEVARHRGEVSRCMLLQFDSVRLGGPRYFWISTCVSHLSYFPRPIASGRSNQKDDTRYYDYRSALLNLRNVPCPRTFFAADIRLS